MTKISKFIIFSALTLQWLTAIELFGDTGLFYMIVTALLLISYYLYKVYQADKRLRKKRKPNGTVSTFSTPSSGGIEPVFTNNYIRRNLSTTEKQ